LRSVLAVFWRFRYLCRFCSFVVVFGCFALFLVVFLCFLAVDWRARAAWRKCGLMCAAVDVPAVPRTCAKPLRVVWFWVRFCCCCVCSAVAFLWFLTV